MNSGGDLHPPSNPAGGGFEPTLSLSIVLNRTVTMVTGGPPSWLRPLVTIKAEVTMVTVPVAIVTRLVAMEIY